MIDYILVIVGMMAVNAFRGGRLVADEELPGRNLFWAVPVVGLLAWLLYSWQLSLAWAATYLFWGVFSWGHLIGFGFHIPARTIPDHEQALVAIAGGFNTYAMALRELYILPGLILIGFLAQAWWIPVLGIPFAILAAGSRRLAWEGKRERAIMVGEILEGAVWGVLVVFTYLGLEYRWLEGILTGRLTTS